MIRQKNCAARTKDKMTDELTMDISKRHIQTNNETMFAKLMQCGPVSGTKVYDTSLHLFHQLLHVHIPVDRDLG